MFRLKGATFQLFLGGPVRSLRSFRTEDITAHNLRNMHIKKNNKFSILQQNISKLAGKLIWYSQKTRVLKKIATKC